jgi:hypothetical protein
MKGKFGIVALLLSSIAVAAPVSTPGPLNDTPIISGGGTVSGGICRAYRTNGEAVPLSGGETLVFYGGGSNGGSAGGYLSTKITYDWIGLVRTVGRDRVGFVRPVRRDGVVFVRTVGRDGECYCVRYYKGSCVEVSCLSGSGIGLFTSPNNTSWNSFIAGAGAGFGNRHGGGWYGEGGGNIYRGTWFREEVVSQAIEYCDRKCSRISIGFEINYNCRTVCHPTNYLHVSVGGVGFHGGNNAVGSGGGASSISAFYNTSLRNATNPGNTLTVLGGGNYGAGRPTLYVCQ